MPQLWQHQRVLVANQLHFLCVKGGPKRPPFSVFPSTCRTIVKEEFFYDMG